MTTTPATEENYVDWGYRERTLDDSAVPTIIYLGSAYGINDTNSTHEVLDEFRAAPPVGVATNYLIEINASILNTVSEEKVAYQMGKGIPPGGSGIANLNPNATGIWYVGRDPTLGQYEAMASLGANISIRNPSIKIISPRETSTWYRETRQNPENFSLIKYEIMINSITEPLGFRWRMSWAVSRNETASKRVFFLVREPILENNCQNSSKMRLIYQTSNSSYWKIDFGQTLEETHNATCGPHAINGTTYRAHTVAKYIGNSIVQTEMQENNASNLSQIIWIHDLPNSKIKENGGTIDGYDGIFQSGRNKSTTIAVAAFRTSLNESLVITAIGGNRSSVIDTLSKMRATYYW